ncbi:MAG TPA: hypothetical protein VEB20_03415 [Azospirillaceae bacterium]|nr:hypothetical protein [Azospirillaceae bacterium]
MVTLLVTLGIAILFTAATVAVVQSRRRDRLKRGQRRVGGLQLLGAVFLGFGEPLDPPTRHTREANTDKPRESDRSGDPPLD